MKGNIACTNFDIANASIVCLNCDAQIEFTDVLHVLSDSPHQNAVMNQNTSYFCLECVKTVIEIVIITTIITQNTPTLLLNLSITLPSTNAPSTSPTPRKIIQYKALESFCSLSSMVLEINFTNIPEYTAKIIPTAIIKDTVFIIFFVLNNCNVDLIETFGVPDSDKDSDLLSGVRFTFSLSTSGTI